MTEILTMHTKKSKLNFKQIQQAVSRACNMQLQINPFKSSSVKWFHFKVFMAIGAYWSNPPF